MPGVVGHESNELRYGTWQMPHNSCLIAQEAGEEKEDSHREEEKARSGGEEERGGAGQEW